jgi:hypothetical protein
LHIRQRVRAGVAAASIGIVVLIGLGIVTAQGPDCSSKQCVYLPAMQAIGPAATPTAVPIPQPNPTCAVNEPPSVEGVQVWLTRYNLAPGDQATLCIRLIID